MLLENKYAATAVSEVGDDMADDDLQIMFVKEAPVFLTLHLELNFTTGKTVPSFLIYSSNGSAGAECHQALHGEEREY